MATRNATALKVIPINKFTQAPAGGHPKAIQRGPAKNKLKKKEGTKPKVMILDTNVLIDDQEAINKFRNNFVVIPITVVRELDRNKGKLFSARHALRALEVSNADDKFKSLENGGQIKIEMVSEVANQLNDDTIIGVAQDYLKKGFGDVVFVTNDRAATIKARALGLTTESYRTNEVDIDSFKKAFTEKEMPKIDRNIVFENGYVKPYVPAYWRQQGVTENTSQEQAIQALFDKKITFVALEGQAGTGKTMIAILAALKMVTDGDYEKVIITKPVVAVGGNDIGFLPGSKEEKMGAWIAPIRDHVDKFLKTQQSKEKHSNAKYPKISVSKSQKERRQESETRIPVENLEMTFDKLVAAGIIEIEAEAFIRGRSFENVIVVIDEAQNFSAAAAKTWMTRMGDGSKLIMTGDVTQIDTPYLSKNNNALSHSAVKTDDQVWSSTIFLDLGVRSIMSDWAANNL